MASGQLHDIYRNRISEFSDKAGIHSRRMNLISLARLVVLIATVWFIVLGVRDIQWAWYLLSGTALAAFLFLVARFNRQKDLRNLNRECRKLNQVELDCLAYRFQQLDDGAGWSDPSHAWSHDLDVFGKGSLFQYLNRTTTRSGNRILAELLTTEPDGPDDITRRQQIIRDMKDRIGFRQAFAARGALISEDISDEGDLRSWLSADAYINKYPWLFYVALLMATSTLAVVTRGLVTGGGYSFLLPILLINFTILTPFLHRTKLYQEQISRKHEVLEGYARLLRIIASEGFSHTELSAQADMARNGMKEVARLSRLLNVFDQRINMLLGAVFNGLFLFDFIMLRLLENWKRKYSSDILRWMEMLGRMDALVSLSGFAYNHPNFIFPEYSGGEAPLVMEGMGHPLIAPEKRVNNDLVIGDERVVIITGANMAGKSTYLRSAGINMVLGYAGCPVCANRFRGRFMGLHSSMRTSDSLADEESYFLAEIRRLQKIVSRMKEGVPMLILLDEVLKGTNTTDKRKGSVGLIRGALSYPVRCLIATHDLSLGEMEKELPGKVVNYCFESYIRDLELDFDYTLRKGIATNMNASFLMQKMGIME